MSDLPSHMNTFGRPTKYDPLYCQSVIDAAKRGLSLIEFASEIDVAHSTLLAWVEKHDDFRLSYEKAKGILTKWYTDRAKIVAFGGQDEAKGVDAKYAKPQVMNILLQNLLGWKERSDVTSNDQAIQGPQVYVPAEKDKE